MRARLRIRAARPRFPASRCSRRLRRRTALGAPLTVSGCDQRFAGASAPFRSTRRSSRPPETCCFVVELAEPGSSRRPLMRSFQIFVRLESAVRHRRSSALLGRRCRSPFSSRCPCMSRCRCSVHWSEPELSFATFDGRDHPCGQRVGDRRPGVGRAPIGVLAGVRRLHDDEAFSFERAAAWAPARADSRQRALADAGAAADEQRPARADDQGSSAASALGGVCAPRHQPRPLAATLNGFALRLLGCLRFLGAVFLARLLFARLALVLGCACTSCGIPSALC